MFADRLHSGAQWERIFVARFALGALSLAIVLGLDWAGEGFPLPAREGLYLTVAFGFASIVASALWRREGDSSALFPFSQIAMDVAMVTSLVYFSGDPESFFTFLYLTVTIYG